MVEAFKVGSDTPIWVSNGDIGNVSVSFQCDRKYEMPENAWLEVHVTAILNYKQALTLADMLMSSGETAKRVKELESRKDI